jgi:phosphatidylglycerol:prolipoprotein diacylglycerol transferase
MYPLVQIGPLNLSSGGLLLLLALVMGSTLTERVARGRGGAALADQVSQAFLPVLLGAIIGGRLWYGLFSWEVYGANPALLLALRLADLAWPGALLGGILSGWLWCRWRRCDAAAVADAAALGIPLAQAVACVGLLLSGEAFGAPTALPWGIPLFGASRHPTQIYLALAALLSYGMIWAVACRPGQPGMLFATYLGLQGLTLMLVEPLRTDSLLLPYGVRVAQVVGLGLLLAVLLWLRSYHSMADSAAERVGTQRSESGVRR